MSPSFSTYNSSNGMSRDSVGVSNRKGGFGDSPIPYNRNIVFGNLLKYAGASSKGATLFAGVFHVIFLGANKQMRRITAKWIISAGTVVAYAQSFTNRPVRQCPSNTVGLKVALVLGRESSVSSEINAARPEPTPRFGFFSNVSPETRNLLWSKVDLKGEISDKFIRLIHNNPMFGFSGVRFLTGSGSAIYL